MHAHLVQVVRAVGLSLIDTQHNTFDLIASGPLNVTRMLLDATDILSHFGLDRLQQEIVKGI